MDLSKLKNGDNRMIIRLHSLITTIQIIQDLRGGTPTSMQLLSQIRGLTDEDSHVVAKEDEHILVLY